jgi:tRNA-binding protein
MKEQITYDDFSKIDIRVGTVISVKKNEKARKPSLVIEVDFGKDIGVKQSSAQITHYYNEENLKGKQVIGVCNFPEKNIAGVVSQVLILGSIDNEGKVFLIPKLKPEYAATALFGPGVNPNDREIPINNNNSGCIKKLSYWKTVFRFLRWMK